MFSLGGKKKRRLVSSTGKSGPQGKKIRSPPRLKREFEQPALLDFFSEKELKGEATCISIQGICGEEIEAGYATCSLCGLAVFRSGRRVNQGDLERQEKKRNEHQAYFESGILEINENNKLKY